MSMKVQPIPPDLLLSTYEILMLLEKYKDNEGSLVAVSMDEETDEPVMVPEGVADFMYSMQNQILWGHRSCESKKANHYSLPIFGLLSLFHEINFNVVCSLHFKNHTKELQNKEWIKNMLLDKETSKNEKNIINKLLLEGNIQINLLECYSFIESLFVERTKVIQNREYNTEFWQSSTGGLPPYEYSPFDNDFLSIDFLESKHKLIPLLQNFLRNYVDNFVQQKIDWGDKNIYKWEKQMKMVMTELRKLSENFGEKFWLPLNQVDLPFPDISIRRVETIIALAIKGTIKIQTFSYKRVEDKIVIEAKISMLESEESQVPMKILGHKNPAIAVLTMNKDSFGRILVNEIEIHNPSSGSPADNLMGKLLDDGKDKLDASLIKEVKAGSKRPISNIISDFIAGDARKLFFPQISEKKLTFRRVITQKDLDNAKISLENILLALSQSKEVGRSGKKLK